MPDSRRNKLLIIIGSIFAILVMILFFARHFIYNQIEERVLTGISETLFTDAELEFESLRVGFFPASITITGLELVSHQDHKDYRINKAGDLLKSLRIEEVRISSFDLFNVIRNNNLTFGDVHITSPRIDFVPPPGKVPEQNGGNGSNTDTPALRVADVQITGADIGLYRSFNPDDNAIASLVGFELYAKDFSYDGTQVLLKEIFSSLNFSATELETELNEFYNMKLDHLQYSSSEKSFSIRSSRIIPTYTAQLKSQVLGHQTDHFDGTSGTIALHDFDPDAWITDRRLKAGHIYVEGTRLYISRDKNFDDKPRTERALPAVLFYRLPFGVMADTLTWNNGMITYREWRPGQVRAGEVLFDEINLKAYNFQNIDNTELLRFDTSTKLMGESDLNVKFIFSMQEHGRHEVNGSLSAMDLKKFNIAFEPMAFARIKSGNLSELTFHMVLDETNSEGEITIIYDDLELRMLDEETLEESRRLQVASFFANLMRIKSSNSPDDPRIAKFELERDRKRSMFTYWWHTLRQGLKESVGM